MLPIHSMVAFWWGVSVTTNYNRFPSFLLFSVAWILLACNEYVSKAPSPWHKAKNFVRSILFYFEAGALPAVRILPDENKEEQTAFQKKRENETARLKKEAEMEAQKEAELRKELGIDLDVDPSEDITTEKGGVFKSFNVNPLKPVLHPIQLQLEGYVRQLRIAKSLILWDDSYYSLWIVILSFGGSIVLYWIPFGLILRWVLRVAVWLVLGPWMAIVDHYYFREESNLSEEQRLQIMQDKLKARYEQLLETASNIDVRRERALKLKSMSKYMFGKYLLRVPRFKEDYFKDTPLPESFAEPFDKLNAPPIKIAERKYGQRLEGDMIPMRSIQEATLPPARPNRREHFRKGLSKAFSKRGGEKTPLLEDGKGQPGYDSAVVSPLSTVSEE